VIYIDITYIIEEESNKPVAKWGNSQAIWLPAPVVRAMELREGDDIEVLIAAERVF
jgi:antitoxin component of MazEF toxin-antitoxin module